MRRELISTDFFLSLPPLFFVLSKFSTCLVNEVNIPLHLKIEMLSSNSIYLWKYFSVFSILFQNYSLRFYYLLAAFLNLLKKLLLIDKIFFILFFFICAVVLTKIWLKKILINDKLASCEFQYFKHIIRTYSTFIDSGGTGWTKRLWSTFISNHDVGSIGRSNLIKLL